MTIDERARRAADDLHRQIDAGDGAVALDVLHSRRRFPVPAAVAVLVLVAVTAGLLVVRDDDGVGIRTDTDEEAESPAPDAPSPAFGAPDDGKASMQLPVTVEPAVGLQEGDEVAVEGAGFNPGHGVGVVMCLAEARGETNTGVDACDIGQYETATPDGTGHMTARYRVRRVINTPVSGTVDCAERPERCMIAVGQLSDYDVSGGFAISFAEGLPPLEHPVLAVTPSENLRHGDEITVAGTGFTRPADPTNAFGPAPGQIDGGVTLSLCDATEHDACWFYPQPVPIAEDGSIQVRLRAWRAFSNDRTPGAPPVDCAVGGCVLRSHVPLGLAPARVPLSFDPAGPLPEPPRLEVDPVDGLAPGDQVTVVVDQLPPGALVGLAVCGNPPGAEFCELYAGLTEVVADDDGRAEGQLTVPVTGGPEGYPPEYDCTAAPGRCSITLLGAGFRGTSGDSIPIPSPEPVPLSVVG